MNKTVLITGATSGIGLGCARKFAENGDRLILTGRNEKRLEEITAEKTKAILPGPLEQVARSILMAQLQMVKNFSLWPLFLRAIDG